MKSQRIKKRELLKSKIRKKQYLLKMDQQKLISYFFRKA